MIAPVLEEIAAEYDGKLQIAKLDVDHNSQSAMQYGVTNIPTLILFKGGQAVERVVGFMPTARILAKLTPHLLATPHYATSAILRTGATWWSRT